MASSRLTSVCLVIIATVTAAAALVYTQSIMLPFLFALTIAYVCAPLMYLLEDRARLPRSLAMVIIALLLLAILWLVGMMVGSAVASLAANIDVYQEKLTLAAERLSMWMSRSSLLGNWAGPDQFMSMLANLPFFSYLKTAAGGLVKGVSDVTLVFLFTMFLLSGERFVAPPSPIWRKIDVQIRAYLVWKLILSALTAGLSGIVFAVFGLEMGLLFVLLIFVLNFIPNIGSIIATLLPLPVALIQYDTPLPVLAVILVPAVLHFVVGNVIEPKILGHSLDLHPVSLLLTLMFWGLIWGVPGMILATPITVIMKIILEAWPSGRPLAALLAGRLPSSPGNATGA